MNLVTDRTVRELAIEIPGATRVFEISALTIAAVGRDRWRTRARRPA